MKAFRYLIAGVVLTLSACSKCNESEAYNKMLALNKVAGRIAAAPGDAGVTVSAAMSKETAPISELIAKQEYGAACELADQLAAKYKINLTEEQKDMLTYEKLQADGGKGSGTCSVADAAKKQMELHGMLQAEVDAGRKSPDIFRQFNEDTVGYAEMLATNPSAACKLFDDLKVKYKL